MMEEYHNCSVENVTSIAERADSWEGLEEAVRFGPAEHKMAPGGLKLHSLGTLRVREAS